MALSHRKRANNSAPEYFADRVPESEALVTSLAHHQRAMADDIIDGEVLRNVLTFFGIGGIGKSELSMRLETWTTTGLDRSGDWGRNPYQGTVLTCRWNLKDSRGSVDVLRLLISVRETVGEFKPSWPAFDLAFAAYFSSVRPGEALPQFGGSNAAFESGLLSTLSDLAQDLGSMNLVAGLASSVLRRALSHARKEVKRRAAYKGEPELDKLIGECLAKPSAGHQAPELAASMLWLLSREIDRMSPQERPLIAVFVDHFEYLQVSARRDGEQTINQFVAALPYFLFVITGRNALDWHHSERGDLAHAGPAVFPQLTSSLASDPRQHLVGTLSTADTLDLLLRRRDSENLNINDDLLAQLAETTGGWPVHLEVVLTLAREMLVHSNRPLGLNDIGGTFETVVRRLLDDLAPEEKRILQACCLLPYFDVELAAAVGNVDVGAVERFTLRTLVSTDTESRYTFRIHDQVRAAVQAAGARVEGGWAKPDWTAAAGRGLAEAKERLEEASISESDADAMAALALAFSIVSEYSIWEEWLSEALRRAPSINGLRPLVSDPGTVGLHPNMRAASSLITALASPPGEPVLASLEELFTGDTPFAASGGLWKAYRLRSWGRVDESIETLRKLLDRFPEKGSLYRRQLNVTLSTARRFQDAQADFINLTPAQRVANEDSIRRSHGENGRELLIRYDARIARAKAKESRRFVIELQTDGLILRSRSGSVPVSELNALTDLCTTIGHPGIKAVLRVHGYRQLRQPDEFDEILEQLNLYSTGIHPNSRVGHAELLSLHAMATGNSSSLNAAFEMGSALDFRPRSWIPIEILLEHLGKPLPPVSTQWLEPYPVVRDRWLAIMNGIVSRSTPPNR